MIIANGLDITCSYGDTFSCAWEIEGASAGDDITFSVKATANSSDVIHQAKCDVSDRLINVSIPAATFADIPVGSYVYDLVLRSEGQVTTLLFPANLHIKAVVHSE